MKIKAGLLAAVMLLFGAGDCLADDIPWVLQGSEVYRVYADGRQELVSQTDFDIMYASVDFQMRDITNSVEKQRVVSRQFEDGYSTLVLSISESDEVTVRYNKFDNDHNEVVSFSSGGVSELSVLTWNKYEYDSNGYPEASREFNICWDGWIGGYQTDVTSSLTTHDYQMNYGTDGRPVSKEKSTNGSIESVCEYTFNTDDAYMETVTEEDGVETMIRYNSLNLPIERVIKSTGSEYDTDIKYVYASISDIPEKAYTTDDLLHGIWMADDDERREVGEYLDEQDYANAVGAARILCIDSLNKRFVMNAAGSYAHVDWTSDGSGKFLLNEQTTRSFIDSDVEITAKYIEQDDVIQFIHDGEPFRTFRRVETVSWE